jgi:tRNA (cytidine32/uridine32-2'-O)-methyltransferase
MDLTRIDVVLVRPARAANVAAACRALKNMGLRSLVLVDPPAGLQAPEARALAYGAWDVLDGAARRATLREGVAGDTWVAGTSGRARADALSPRQLAEEAGTRVGDGRLAVVFGPEASGLTDDELAQCHARVHIPADPAHPSLNLAQAVLLIAYELRLAAPSHSLSAAAPAPTEPAERATAGQLEAALDDFRRALLGIGYLNPANPEAILAEWRGLLARAAPSRREVSLLRGLARQILWAASAIARPGSGDHNPGPFEGGHS